MTMTKQDALDYHANGRPGKLKITPTKPMETQLDLFARVLSRCGAPGPGDRRAAGGRF